MLKLLDFSKVTFGFHIDGNEFYKTSLVGSLYLGMIIFLIYFTSHTFSDYISGYNYNLIKIDKILHSPPEINLNEYMLRFGFSIVYSNNTPLQLELLDDYFKIELKHISRENSKKNETMINLIKCTESHFFNLYNTYSDFIKNEIYLDYYCMSQSNLTIKGSYNDEKFLYYQYSLSLNWTKLKEKNMTYDNNFIEKDKLKLVFKYFDYSIDVDDYYDPIRSYENQVFNFIDINITKKYDLDFSLTEFEDDKHILLTSSNKEIFPTLRFVEKYFYLDKYIYDKSNDLQLLFIYYIRSSNNKIIYKRIYKKLPEMLSQISGLASNFLFFVIIFSRFYNKFKSKEELINLILKFKEIDKDQFVLKKISHLNSLYKDRLNKYKQRDIKKRKKSKEVCATEKNSKNLINYFEKKNIEMNDIDIRYKDPPIKRELIELYDFKDNLFIPENENVKIHINNFKYNSNKINKNNSQYINKENNLNEINDNYLFPKIDNDNSLQRIINPKNQIIGKSNIKNSIFADEDNLDSFTRKTSFDHSISRDEYSKKINHTENNMVNNINSNLTSLKKKLYLEENQQINNKQDFKNLKENKCKSRKNFSNSISVNKDQLTVKKLFKRELQIINGNFLFFNFSFFEIFCRPLFSFRKSFSKKFILYDKAFNSINHHLHIYSYLKAIQEIDIIKNAQFTIDEIKIIDFISKPIISEQDKQEFLIDEDLKKNKLIREKNLNFNGVLEVYEKILEKMEMRDITKNLLKPLSFQLNYLFEDK